jgi:hypothetical protein
MVKIYVNNQIKKWKQFSKLVVKSRLMVNLNSDTLVHAIIIVYYIKKHITYKIFNLIEITGACHCTCSYSDRTGHTSTVGTGPCKDFSILFIVKISFSVPTAQGLVTIQVNILSMYKHMFIH